MALYALVRIAEKLGMTGTEHMLSNVNLSLSIVLGTVVITKIRN